MKKLFITTLFSALVIFALPVSANEGELEVRATARLNASSTPTKDHIEVKSRVETSGTTSPKHSSSTERVINKASSTARRIMMQQEVIKKIMTHVSLVYSATIDRLEKILSRVDERIAKVKANGGSTTEAEIAVAQARAHLIAAQQNVSAFLSLDLSAIKLQENMDKVREQSELIKMHLKEAHRSLTDAVKSLKGKSDEGHATSTKLRATTTVSEEEN